MNSPARHSGLCSILQCAPNLLWLSFTFDGCKCIGTDDLLHLGKALPENLQELHFEFRKCCIDPDQLSQFSDSVSKTVTRKSIRSEDFQSFQFSHGPSRRESINRFRTDSYTMQRNNTNSIVPQDKPDFLPIDV